MLALQDKIGDNQQLIDSIHGANQAMMDLAKTPDFNATQFDTFQQIAVDAMQRLEASGFSAAQAMESDAGLRGMLQNIIFLSEQYGIKINDNTQALIDEGIASGALTEQQKSESDIMIDGFDRMSKGIERLVELMGGEMPDAVDEMARRSVAAIDGISQSTSRWGGSVGQVYDSLGDVIDRVNVMGDTHSQVMKGGSIIPDTEEWEKKNWDIARQLKTDMVDALNAMGENSNSVIAGMIGDAEDLNQLYGGLGLAALAEGREAGAYERYGVVPEERKEEMTATFKELAHLWGEERETIVGSKGGMAAFLRDIEGLTVVGDLSENFETFLASMRQWNANVQAGKVWDETNQQWFQHGTGPQGFTVPAGYPNDNFKAGFSSGEKIFVEPTGGFHGAQNITSGGDTWNLYVTINAAPGGETPRSLMDKLYYGLKNNVGSGKAKLKKIGVQIDG
jgi:hypothetical protein